MVGSYSTSYYWTVQATWQSSRKHCGGPNKLPNQLDYDDARLLPAFEIEVNTSNVPQCIQEKAMWFLNSNRKENVESLEFINNFMKELKYSKKEVTEIERLSREQYKSKEWKKYRKGMITASNFKTVSSRVNVILKETERDGSLNSKLVNMLLYEKKLFRGIQQHSMEIRKNQWLLPII